MVASVIGTLMSASSPVHSKRAAKVDVQSICMASAIIEDMRQKHFEFHIAKDNADVDGSSG